MIEDEEGIKMKLSSWILFYLDGETERKFSSFILLLFERDTTPQNVQSSFERSQLSYNVQEF